MGLRGRTNFSDESFFFVTTSIINHFPIFKSYKYCDILVDNIRFYQNRYKFDILAYVIMPTHFHWVVRIENKLGRISDVMRDIKSFSAKQILEKLIERDRKEILEMFRDEAEDIHDQDHKIWQERFDDQVIRNEKMFWIKLRYIHNNPVKAGLVYRVEDYKYSSARNYIKGDHSVLFVDTTYAGIEIGRGGLL